MDADQTMRIACSTTGLALILALTAPSSPGPSPAVVRTSAAIDDGFRGVVRPFLAQYCLGCHGKDDPEGDLDLSAYPDAPSATKDPARWALVLDRLRKRTMPPPKAKPQPGSDARDAVVAWIEAARKAEADRNAGDPGIVLARRLSNAEYDHSVRDLTGVDLRPTREFPVDPANEAGFDNSGESLSMSPSLVRKYLEAARRVADHLVLTPSGFGFADHPMIADTDRDKYCVRRIIDFYKRQRTDLADYFLAAWRFRKRSGRGRPEASLDDFAAESGINAPYLATVWSILDGPAAESGPIAAIQSLWRDFPEASEAAARDSALRLRDFVNDLRRRLTPEVKNLHAPGVHDGSQALVLWKNRQYAANRRLYRVDASKIGPEALTKGTSAARLLALTGDLGRSIGDFERFCSVFPDAFYVSERARVYLDPKQEAQNAGRLLSAGFHSMTGYFRDDAPLSDLILDDSGCRELNRLWEEFDFITGAPSRQYASFLWFERTDSGFLRGAEFDFARAEDKDAGSEVKIGRLAEVYRSKAKRRGAGEVALGAIDDYFRIMGSTLRGVEAARIAAEPRHISALQDFATRAYRRPLKIEEGAGIAGFYRELREKDGLSHEDAIRDSVVSILLSPHFCYRADLPGSGPGIAALSDYDLASRLSYFLWSSLPDAELLERAAAGDLHEPEVLKAQARRMLRDARIRGLATEFAGNWLDFRRFEEHNSVDRGRFPTFDDDLRRSMFEEPVRFFVDLVQRDGSILDFLGARHTFVDRPLARHYGIKTASFGPDGWARIDDAGPFGRGGLLPMAVFLTKNSPGLRTSPVKRGYWVVRRLLGEAIPAPPANVPDLPDDEAKLGDLTLRAALARHRAEANCAACHDRFDALGLAFEGFGPVGESRVLDLGGRPVDASGTFPGGVEGLGLEGLRAYLQGQRREEFVENLSRKLLAFALGRTLLPSDDRTVAAIRAKLDSEGNRFGAMVEEIVVSPQFRNRRTEITPSGSN